MRFVSTLKKQLSWPTFAFAVFSALLLVAAFTPFKIFPLVFVGLVPFLIRLKFLAENNKRAEALWLGFITSVLFIFGGFYWVSHVAVHFGQLPWILGVLVLVLFSTFGAIQFPLFALFGFYFFRTKKLSPWLQVFMFSAAFTGIDFLVPKIFPDTLGHCLYYWFPLAQTAEWWGIYGLTFLAAFTNAAFFVVRKSKLPIACALIALTAFHFWGDRRIKQIEDLTKQPSKSLRLNLIQANIGDLDKFASESGYYPALQKVLSIYEAMSRKAVAESDPDLVIWPETAYPVLYQDHSDSQADQRKRWIRNLTQSLGKPLLFGGYSARDTQDFNSLFLVNTKGELTYEYNKSVLLAFGETLPLGPFNKIIRQIVPTIADFGHGVGPTHFEFNGFKIGPNICYELIMPDFVRAQKKQGADFILNITNDSWFGNTTEPELHLLLALFRAIELRTPVVRATNTGISIHQSATGKVLRQTAVFEETTVPLTVSAAPQITTFYLKYGNWLPWFCLALCALFAVFHLSRRFFLRR